jgi:hypothetical protein
MTTRRSFLLRIDPDVLDAVQRWANDDLRSLNGQIEFLLRTALRQSGRVAPAAEPASEAVTRAEPAGASPPVPPVPPVPPETESS